MDFSSFDITDLNEQSSQPVTPLGGDPFGSDVSTFFDFINPTTFNSTTGTDQPQPTTDSCMVTNQSNATNESSTPLTTNTFSLMSPMNADELAFLTPSQQPQNADCMEDEDFLTPLMSPAIPPNYFDSLRSDTNFSPLTSPALGPQRNGSIGYNLEGYHHSTQSVQEGQSPEELQTRLAMIERQQQQLRAHMQQSSSSATSSTSSSASSSSSSSPIHKSTVYGNASSFTSSPTTISSVSKPKQQTLRHKIAMSSPKFNPVTHLRSPGIHPLQSNQIHTATHLQSTTNYPAATSHQKSYTMTPATPSLLMKLGTGTHQTGSHNNNTMDQSSPTHPNNSPFVLPMASLHESMIDTMMTLPDAMLPPSENQPSAKKPTKADTSKRRRISYPRSAFTPPALFPSSPGPSTNNGMTSLVDQGIAALISPAALRPHHHPSSLPAAMMFSPGIMMSPKVNGGNNTGIRTTTTTATTSSPRALKPLISPSLQPDGKRCHASSIDEQEAAAILATKSNYQALHEGQAKTLGIDFTTTIPSGMENRRSAHKAAEQRRRDTLKQNFDALRMELLESIVAEDALQQQDDGETSSEQQGNPTRLEREKKVKQMSKVVLLQHSYEYLLRLKSENQRKDAKLEQMTMEIQQLRSQLGMEPITEQERLAEAEEKLLQKKKRLARLKRLEDMVDT